jgi:type I restriction enzyme, S subunit
MMKQVSEMKTVKLNEVCEVIAGQSPPSSTYNDKGDGIPFFQGKTDFGYLYPSVRSWCNSPQKVALPNDILISVRAPVGPTNINVEKSCIGRGLSAIRCSNEVEVKFLLYYLRSIETKIAEKANGSTFSAITQKDLQQIQIPLPPLATQQKIAAILDAADAYRQLTKTLIAKYDQLAQSLFLDMFGDPVRNEKGWEKVRLSHLYINDKDGTKCGPFGSALKKEEFTNNGIPVWVMDNIQGGRFINKTALFIKKEKYETLASYRTFSGDIIISRAGTVGKMAVVNYEGEAIISTNLIRLRLDKTKLIPLIFIILMNNWGPKVAKLRTGADGAFTHMNTGILNDIEIALPPIALQNLFAERIQHIEAQKQQAQASLQKAEKLFNSLLQRCFGSAQQPLAGS